jgi:hypothetical protein
MKRTYAPLTLVITMLLLVSILVAPATAREINGSVRDTAPSHGVVLPGGGGDSGDPPVAEGDPDELTGGNLSLSDPEKQRVPEHPDLWQSFLNWIERSALILQSSR